MSSFPPCYSIHGDIRFIAWWKHKKDSLPRKWKPKSPEDCPYCRSGIQLERVPTHREVQPWHTRKSSRGRKKSIPTQGFACMNPDCDYFGITDPFIHTLVVNGKRGQGHNIHNLKYQCCRKTFSSRKGTPLYYLKTSTQTVEMTLWFLAEGVDQSVLVRYTGHCDATVTAGSRKWDIMLAAGWHNRLFYNITIAIIQMDELYARVRHPQKRRWL